MNETVKTIALIVSGGAVGLREAQIKSLRAQIQEGVDSGPGVPAQGVLDRLEAKYTALTPKP